MGPGQKYSYRTVFQHVFPSLWYQENPDAFHPASDLYRASDMEVMSIFERVCLRSLHRSILIQLDLFLLTGCLQLDRRDALVLPYSGLKEPSLRV
jgi:hypothetical protein